MCDYCREKYCSQTNQTVVSPIVCGCSFVDDKELLIALFSINLKLHSFLNVKVLLSKNLFLYIDHNAFMQNKF